jgi:hypothetical protein
MIEYFLLFCIIFVFSSSYYLHFVDLHTVMIGYIGIEHPRLFEQQYGHEIADLIVFKKRPFRSKRMQFALPGTESSYLGHYQHILIVHQLYPQVPLFYDTDNNIQYMHDNITIAELWHQKHTGKRIQLHV